MALRESWPRFWWDRHVLRRKPRLHRLVVHVTDHCNLNCAGCTHFSNISEPGFASVEEFERDMARLAVLFSAISEIYLLGGEPLLHPDLIEFMRITREQFPESSIKVMTNGVLAHRMEAPFWEALREYDCTLVCDLYPIALKVERVDALAAEHGATVEWTESRDEFFRLPIDPAGGHDVADAFERCRWVNNCPILRDGKLYPCAYTAYVDILKEKFGLDGMEVTEDDSVSIYAEDDGYTVMDFLVKPVPWCQYCDFDAMVMRPWSRSKHEAGEWIDAE
jgi:ABC-2 type transport system ATP-binding protein